MIVETVFSSRAIWSFVVHGVILRRNLSISHFKAAFTSSSEETTRPMLSTRRPISARPLKRSRIYAKHVSGAPAYIQQPARKRSDITLRHPRYAPPDAPAAQRLHVRRDLRSHFRDEVCRISIPVSEDLKGYTAVAIEQIDRLIDVDVVVPGAYAPADRHAQVRSRAFEAGRQDRRRQVTPHCRSGIDVLPRDRMGDRRQMVRKRFREILVKLSDDLGARLCVQAHLLPIEHDAPSAKSAIDLRQHLDRRIPTDGALRYFKCDRYQIARRGIQVGLAPSDSAFKPAA
jgi:hypothetical protein